MGDAGRPTPASDSAGTANPDSGKAEMPTSDSGGIGTTTPDTYEEQRYKIYLQETSSYAQEKLEIFKILPTFLVSISTFMFGGSVWALSAFQGPKWPELLVVTWICLGLSISLMLLELLSSLRAYEREGEITTVRYMSKKYDEVHVNEWGNLCVKLQNGTVVLFVFGIISFLTFFSRNLSTPRSSDASPKTSAAGSTTTGKAIKDVKRAEEAGSPPTATTKTLIPALHK